MRYWLMKTEPDVFGIDDLKQRKNQTEHWDGVRNYQARNMLRDDMQKGDLLFFYHSNCKQPAIVGIAKIVHAGYPDHTQFDKNSKYFDAKSDPANPRWFMVDVKFVKKFEHPVSLERLKNDKALQEMPLVKRGNRLSIMPVTKEQWTYILKLAE